jgi:hypothetical protein
MRKSKVFKFIAVVNFIALLTVFLLYRNGSLDKYIYNDANNNFTSPNGGVGAKNNNASTKVKTDSLQRQRISSSKSLVIIDHVKLKADTTKHKKDTAHIKRKQEPIRMMSGSKSGPIIEPKLFNADSMYIELRPQKKKSIKQ